MRVHKCVYLYIHTYIYIHTHFIVCLFHCNIYIYIYQYTCIHVLARLYAVFCMNLRSTVFVNHFRGSSSFNKIRQLLNNNWEDAQEVSGISSKLPQGSGQPLGFATSAATGYAPPAKPMRNNLAKALVAVGPQDQSVFLLWSEGPSQVQEEALNLAHMCVQLDGA